MFRDLTKSLRHRYTSDQCNIAKEFYEPILMNAISFDRTSGYFSANALSMYAYGLEYFSQNGHKYRLIISKEIDSIDFAEIKKGYKLREEIRNQLLNSLDESIDLEAEKNLSNLAFYIANGTVEIKIAFKTKGIFHDKLGIAVDSIGDIIVFGGSNNETEAAVDANYESFQVDCSWLSNQEFYLNGIRDAQIEFEKLWNDEKDDLVIRPADEVILKEILKYNKGKIIVEEILLKDNSVILDYNQQLLLQFNTDGIDWFTQKAFYKMKIIDKVEKVANNTIYFKKDLCYPEFIKLDGIFQQKIPLLGYDYYTTNRLKDYIESRNMYIEKRATLGLEIKSNTSHLEDRYEIFKDIVASCMHRNLRDKQMHDAFFMYAMMKSGNFSVPGSGKTTSALAVYAFLKHNNVVSRIVMIGPKNSFATWIDEFKGCFGEKEKLNYFSIQDSNLLTTEKKLNKLRYETSNCNLFLFNYESIGNYCNEIKSIVSHNTILIFDEVHKVKALNGKYASFALEIAKYAHYKIVMTGTPIPNSYADLYNILNILYCDEYREFFGFPISMLKSPSPKDIEVINSKIQPFYCRTTKEELNVPYANKDILCIEPVSIMEQKIFDILLKKYSRNKLALFIRILQLESNPKMLLKAIDWSEFVSVFDMTDDSYESDFIDYSSEVIKLINSIDISSKKRKCIELIQKLVKENKKVVIWCIFQDTIRDITRILTEMGIKCDYIMGETPLDDRINKIEQFKCNMLDVLITNPHTLAESISLHTVCHDAIYFEYSYNLVHLLQSKDRIHRLGLEKNQYTQYYFMANVFSRDGLSYSMDNIVYNRLLEKEDTMLKAIENNVFEPVYTQDEDLDLIFGDVLKV